MVHDPYSSESFILKRDDEAIRVWNSITVVQKHNIRRDSTETEYEVYESDGEGEVEPVYITPAMDTKLDELGIDHDYEVVDPLGDNVTIL